jgi:hypothetical protein
MRNLSVIIALSAAGFTAAEAVPRDSPPPPITIAGDFVPDRGDIHHAVTEAILKEEIDKPVKVEWHEGITISEVLKEAGLRPLHDHANLTVRSGDTLIHVAFQSLHSAKHSDIVLQPGAGISYWALLW